MDRLHIHDFTGQRPTTDAFRQGLRELGYPQSILLRADEVIQ
jgi:hypothetical protein